MILTLICGESGEQFERTPGLKSASCKLLCSDPWSYGGTGAWHCASVCKVREVVSRRWGIGEGGVLRISPCINLPKTAILQPQQSPLLYHFNCYWFSASATSTFQSPPHLFTLSGHSTSCSLLDSFLVFRLPPTNLFVFPFIFLSLYLSMTICLSPSAAV